MGSTEWRTTVGFDVATSLGWSAVQVRGEERRVLMCGHVDLGGVAALARMREIDRILDATQPDAVAYERVDFMVRRLAYTAHVAVRTLIEVATEARGLPLLPIAVKTLKAYAGHGNNGKPDMIAAAQRMFPGASLAPPGKPGTKVYEVRRGDIADATLIAAWGAGCDPPAPAARSAA